jgi:metallophosphoesterase (TIGR00282 family)
MSEGSGEIRVLLVGDVVGKPGRKVLEETLSSLVDRHRLDLVVANGENAAGGFGITRETAGELFAAGVDVITTGNHVWDKKEALELLAGEANILRPANYPPAAPGRGWCVASTPGGVEVLVVNLSGRVFMDLLDCPFRAADAILAQFEGRIPCRVVDMHAEATSEKRALSLYLDGRVSAVCGTHTHIPTDDARLLPGGTAYITDLGMTGNEDGSVIGIEYAAALKRFLSQMPSGFSLAKGTPVLNGAVVAIDSSTGKASSITRISRSLERPISP